MSTDLIPMRFHKSALEYQRHLESRFPKARTKLTCRWMSRAESQEMEPRAKSHKTDSAIEIKRDSKPFNKSRLVIHRKQRLTARSFREEMNITDSDTTDSLCGHLAETCPSEQSLLLYGFCDSRATLSRQVPQRFLPSLVVFTNKVINSVLRTRQSSAVEQEISPPNVAVMAPLSEVILCYCGCYIWERSDTYGHKRTITRQRNCEME